MANANDFETRLRTLEARFDPAELAILKLEHDQMHKQLGTFNQTAFDTLSQRLTYLVTNMTHYVGLCKYHGIDQTQDRGMMDRIQDLKVSVDPVIGQVDLLTSAFNQFHVEGLVAQVERTAAQVGSMATQIEHIIEQVDLLTSTFNKLHVEDVSTQVSRLVGQVDRLSAQNSRMSAVILESAIQGRPVRDVFRLFQQDGQ